MVSEVNPDDLADHRGIVANPNCSTMQTVVALKPILDAAGIERLVITTMQSVSGTGQRAVEELHDQTRAVIEAAEIPPPAIYPHQIAFNVIPQAGSFPADSDSTDEELKLVNETRKILGRSDIGVSATCTRVPVYTGHSESVNVQTRDPLSAEDCRELLASAPGVTVLVASCPHCFNTLANEYPDFGGCYEVVHHTELLAELVRVGRLAPAGGDNRGRV